MRTGELAVLKLDLVNLQRLLLHDVLGVIDLALRNGVCVQSCVLWVCVCVHARVQARLYMCACVPNVNRGIQRGWK